MKQFILLSFMVLGSWMSWGQNAIVGDDFSDGWGSTDCNSMNANNFEYLGQLPSTNTYIKIDNPDITGEAYFRFGVKWGESPTTYKQLTITNGVDEPISFGSVYQLSTTCTTSGAIKFNANTAYKYVFKTLDAGTNPTGKFIVFEVQGDVRTISNVTNPITIGPGEDYPVTATLDGALNTGQGVYLRYSTDNFTTSTVVSMAHDSGNDYTGSIPSAVNIQGTTVEYYVFTSGDNLVFDGTSPNPSVIDADFYAINLINNGGSNYSYLVDNTIDLCGSVSPSTGIITMGQDFNVETKVYVSGLTNTSTGAIDEITCWIGYSASNTNPNTWTNWVQATFDSNVSNDDKYKANLKDILPNSASMNNPDFYFASRFQLNNGSYYYGGTGTSSFWNSDNGTLDVQPISLYGNATGNTDISMYSSDGLNFSVTTSLVADNVKFRKNNDWVTNWGSSSFPSGTGTQDGADIPVSTTGTYLVTLNISTGVYNFSNINCTSSTTTTWDGNNWSHGNPDFTKKALFDGDYTTTSTTNISACECEINSGKTITVADNTFFTVAKKITNNGEIVVKNQGNVIQYSSDTNDGSGTYKVEKNEPTTTTYDYVYWGSPLNVAQIETVFAANPTQRIYTFDTTKYKDIYSGDYVSGVQTSGSSDGFDDDVTTGNNAWVLTNSGTLPAGRGLVVMASGSTIPFDPDTVGNAAGGGLKTFTGGVFNNGDISVIAQGDLYSGYDDFNNNQNIIANPYPSAISADRFLAANTVTVNALYFWTHKTPLNTTNPGPFDYNFSNADYATYNASGGVASANGGAIPTGNIASCQGFMVSVPDTGVGSSITFTNLMRLSENNNNFYRVEPDTENEIDKIWLSLNTDQGFYRQVLVAFNPEATDVYDAQYDASRIQDPSVSDFYTVCETKPLAIQTLSTFDDTKTVNVGMNLIDAGEYQIALDQLQGIFNSGQAIYLEDTYTSIIHDFANGPYTFSSEAGQDINDRFVLRFTNDALQTNAYDLQNLIIYPNPSNGVFHLSGNANYDITVYDVMGKKVWTAASQNKIDLSNLQQGIYIAHIQKDGQSINTKLVVQ